MMTFYKDTGDIEIIISNIKKEQEKSNICFPVSEPLCSLTGSQLAWRALTFASMLAVVLQLQLQLCHQAPDLLQLDVWMTSAFPSHSHWDTERQSPAAGTRKAQGKEIKN